jgi:DNA polymerase II
VTSARGFILQASYRIAPQPDGRRRPIVQIYGQLEQGGSFLVRDDRQRPHFYVRAADAQAARRLRSGEPQAVERRTFAGEAVCRIEVDVPGDVPPLRDRLHAAGVETFEADVRFASRYLIERGIRAGCEIEGTAARAPDGLLVFDNPILRPADVRVAPRVLSFDIETDAKGERLLAIALFAPGLDEVLIVAGAGREMPERATRCADESAALDAFCARVRALDPDVITGWNIVDFDLTALARVAQRLHHPFDLGREPGSLRIRKPEGYFGSGQASVPGRVVLDGIDLLRGAFIRMEDYSLDAVAREVLGEGKALAGEAHERVREILHNYRHDLPAFARYARTDARLAYRIIEKLELVPLALARSRLTGMTPDRVAASIASFDFLYLSALEPLRIVAPSVRGSDARVHVAQQGGHVLEPVTGLHTNVWVFDFKSLYPSLIRTFNIDPLSYVPAPAPGADLIETPGAAFRRAAAILPHLLDELFPRREAAKRSGDTVAAHAIKILMNSFYGVLGTPACRFFNPALANAITGMGKEMLLWSKRWFETAGFTVLYGDTDSLFVRSDRADPEQAVDEARELARRLNGELSAYIAGRWRLDSRLELEFEKLYLKLFLPHARGSARGASKRYAGLLHGAAREVEFVGLEVVRETRAARALSKTLHW